VPLKVEVGQGMAGRQTPFLTVASLEALYTGLASSLETLYIQGLKEEGFVVVLVLILPPLSD